MSSDTVRVAILEDHQLVVDGYTFRLGQAPGIEIVGAVAYGEHLEQLLAQTPVDVVILDVSVPTSPTNPNPYPILNVLPGLLQHYPSLAVLVISMLSERTLVKSLIEAGASGYVLKDDVETSKRLAAVVRAVAQGDVFYSPQVLALMRKYAPAADKPSLTQRQLEALALNSAHPGEAGVVLSKRMGISHSTYRNTLSTAYLRLGVSNRTEAVLKARALGLITPGPPPDSR